MTVVDSAHEGKERVEASACVNRKVIFPGCTFKSIFSDGRALGDGNVL